MGSMNKQMDPQKVMQTMKQFEMESAKMEMKEEMMDDVLDDMLGGSDEEEEQDAIINQVLDEIGIEVAGKVSLSHIYIYASIQSLDLPNRASHEIKKKSIALKCTQCKTKSVPQCKYLLFNISPNWQNGWLLLIFEIGQGIKYNQNEKWQ